jgi:hypothetical protein
MHQLVIKPRASAMMLRASGGMKNRKKDWERTF